MVGPRVVLVDGMDARLIAVEREPALHGKHVARIAVDVHVFGVERDNVDLPCHHALLYLPTPASATSAIVPRIERTASIAVYVQ